ncbi:MAG: hypothetical protein ACPF83_07605 [Flavobacteriales bacterium]
MPQDTLSHLQITSPQDLHNWLLETHGQEEGVWLVTFKKSGTYKERVARLEQEGRMQPNGTESVKRGREKAPGF